MLMFLFICQAPPHFQFTGKLNNWNWEKVCLVVSGCLLVVCVRLLVVCGCLLVVCSRLIVVCDRLCSFVVVYGCCLF